MRRYDCLKAIAPLTDGYLTVANLANTTTEWRSLRSDDSGVHFVGMGMVTSYALGLALALPHRPTLAIDGDGGILFDLSVLASVAQLNPTNLCIVVFDNRGYVSTGGWSSVASLTEKIVDIGNVGKALGIANTQTVETVDDFVAAFERTRAAEGPHLIVARINKEQAFVGTTLMDFKENKYRFARYIEHLEGKTILRPSAKEHGAPPKQDPVSKLVTDDDDFSEIIFDGLKENEVDFVIGLPCSGLAKAQDMCIGDNTMRYIGVAHEGTGFGICAGAWLGGKRPAALVENFGLFASGYHLLRGHCSYGIPTLIVTEYRGDSGDQEFFAEAGEQTLPFLEATRINYTVVSEKRMLKPAIRDGLRWMNIGMRPYAVVPSYEMTRLKPSNRK